MRRVRLILVVIFLYTFVLPLAIYAEEYPYPDLHYVSEENVFLGVPNNVQDWMALARGFIVTNTWQLGSKYRNPPGYNYRFETFNAVGDRVAFNFHLLNGHPQQEAFSVLEQGDFVRFDVVDVDVRPRAMSHQIRPVKITEQSFSNFDNRTVAMLTDLPDFSSIETQGEFPVPEETMTMLCTTWIPFSSSGSPEQFVVDMYISPEHKHYRDFMLAYFSHPVWFDYSSEPLDPKGGISAHMIVHYPEQTKEAGE